PLRRSHETFGNGRLSFFNVPNTLSSELCNDRIRGQDDGSRLIDQHPLASASLVHPRRNPERKGYFNRLFPPPGASLHGGSDRQGLDLLPADRPTQSRLKRRFYKTALLPRRHHELRVCSRVRDRRWPH